MSLDTLKSDLQANLANIAALQPELATPAECIALIREVWAFIESHVDETAEIDGCVSDLIEGAEDILQPETAAVFSAMATGGLVVATALKTRLNKAVPEEAELIKVADELIANCKTGGEILKEIVIDDTDADDDDDEDDDADGDDDDADDADEGADK